MSAMGQVGMTSLNRDVCFTPKSKHCWATAGCPLCAKSGLMQCRKESRYSINFVGYAEHACWRLMSDYWIHRGSLKKVREIGADTL